MKENTKLPLILVLALPILLIMSTSRISIELFEQPIYLITFIFPLTFLVSGLITKKTDSRVAISLVILALILQCFVFVLRWVLLGTIDYILMEVTFLAYFMTQVLFLLGYEVLKETKKTDKFGYILFILLFCTLIETMFYLSVFVKVTVTSLIITIVIKLIYDLVMAKILTK